MIIRAINLKIGVMLKKNGSIFDWKREKVIKTSNKASTCDYGT